MKKKNLYKFQCVPEIKAWLHRSNFRGLGKYAPDNGQGCFLLWHETGLSALLQYNYLVSAKL